MHYATLAGHFATDTGVQTLQAAIGFLNPRIQKQYSYIISLFIYNVLAKVSQIMFLTVTNQDRKINFTNKYSHTPTDTFKRNDVTLLGFSMYYF
jgi:hypothetical protein